MGLEWKKLLITGIAQIDIAWENSKENMKKIEAFVKKASQSNVELVLFPEMSLTGFTMDINKLLLSEEQIINWIKPLAIDNNISIGLGFAIKVDEKGKNKYTIVSNKGDILAMYTKIHPFSYSGEDEKYYKGDEFVIKAANNNKQNLYVKQFRLNGKPCKETRIPFSKIVSGGLLEVEMQDTPVDRY